MKNVFIIFTLLLTLSLIMVGCDNGSAPDSSPSNNLVMVNLTVGGDAVEVSQNSISVTQTDLSTLTYKYNAIPQWEGTNIHGRTDWTTINYSDNMSIGYFSPGQWVFGVQILIGNSVVYQGFSNIVDVANSSVNVTVAVNKLVSQATVGSVRIYITAPTVQDDYLTVSYSGTSSGGPFTVNGESATGYSTDGGRTTFEYTVSGLTAGNYTFTLGHPNGGGGTAISFSLAQSKGAVISGHLDNGIWQVDYITVSVHSITVLRYNEGASQDPLYGIVTTNVSSAAADDRVSFYVKPVSGSRLTALTVTCGGNTVATDRNGDLYTFIMPDGDVIISATFADATVDEVVASHFKAIVSTLYGDNPDVISFGRAEYGPDPLIESFELKNVKIWYDEGSHKICWYSDIDKVKFKAGSMTGFFKDCTKYTSIDLSGFVTTNITDMSSMFEGCSGLTTLNLANLKAGSVTDMSNMLKDCTSLTALTLTGFETNTTTSVNMAGLFENCSSLPALNLSAFNTSKATSMARMFKGCASLTTANFNLANVSTASAADLSSMFQGCSGLTQTFNVSAFNVTSATNMSGMFEGCTGLATINLPTLTSPANNVNMSGLFKGCTKLKTLNNIANFKTSKATSLAYMFQGCTSLSTLNLNNFDASNATDISYMLKGCTNLSTANLTFNTFAINTNADVNMAGFFQGCTKLATLNVSTLNTSRVTNMSYLFCGCKGLTTITFGGSFNTSSVTDMSYMFSGVDSGTGGTGNKMGLTSLDVSSFNTANVTNMSHMFYLCSNASLTSLPGVSGFNTSNVTDMSCMFAGLSGAASYVEELNLSSWNFSNVAKATRMFEWCEKAVITFPTHTKWSRIEDMLYMFGSCYKLRRSSLKTIVASWDFSEHNNPEALTTLFSNSSNSDTYPESSPSNRLFKNTMNGTTDFDVRDKYLTHGNNSVITTLYLGGNINKEIQYQRLTTNPLGYTEQ